MADELPRADETQRGHRAWRRDWFPYDQYRLIHENAMETLERESIVLRDTVVFREVWDDGELVRVNVRGRVLCSHRVVVIVNKWLAVRRDARNRVVVKGDIYAYHAWRRGSPRRDLFRYDDAHGGLHRHYFDSAGRETRIERITYDSLPRLDFIIREAVAAAGGPPI